MRGTLGAAVVWWWLAVSSGVVLWDAGYCLSRPLSLPGGPWHWLWAPYSKYARIDRVYSEDAYLTKDGFPAAQSLMNLLETALNLLFVYLWSANNGASATTLSRPLAGALIAGLVATTMTFSKTVLYFLIDICSGFQSTGHNSWSDFILLYVLPNGLWIVMPLYCMISFASAVFAELMPITALSAEAKNVKGRRSPTPVSSTPTPSARSRSRARSSSVTPSPAKSQPSETSVAAPSPAGSPKKSRKNGKKTA